jgi:hypothetical protein
VIVIPSASVSAKLEQEIKVWRKRLANPELLDKAVFINGAAYKDIRIPEGRGRKGRLKPDYSKYHNWEKETEDYKPLIPTGGQRRAGVESCFDDPVESIALQEMRSRPNDFPNIRVVPSQHGYGHDIWWGEDISQIWNASDTILRHRQLGRAFGYLESEITRLYPDPCWKRLLRMPLEESGFPTKEK